MADIRTVRDMNGLIAYFSENLGWEIDLNDFDDIDDISYEFEAADIGLKDEAFAKIASMRQLQPLVDDQQWGIFCIEFESQRFEVSAIRKILSGLIPRRRASVDHAMWQQQDLLFICNWGEGNNRTIGLAHFEDKENGLPQIKMISCAPAIEDSTQIKHFEDDLKKLSWPRDPSNIEAWRDQWSSAFSVAYREVIQTSSALTVRLAAEAQNIRNRVLQTLEVENENGYVHLLHKKFRDTLIHDMSETAFADMYAQTVVYGLFSARCMDSTQEDFSINEAIDRIPSTNPFLKSLMEECLGADSRRGNYLNATTKLFASFDELDIGNVVEVLANTNTEAIIRDFNRQTGGGKEDPIIHFYEEFLTAYDKAQKIQRGVYYTPQPVVNFIVKSVDDLLKTEFGYTDGLASTETKKIKVQRLSERKIRNGMYAQVIVDEDVPAVQVLDPATGTGTFIRQVILQIYDNFRKKHSGESESRIKEAWNMYVPKHLLPRLNGFELMMAPYAVAHMKLAMVLLDTGYDFNSNERLNVCLTNTLEEPGNSSNQVSMFDDPLAMESIEASKIKKNSGINVLIGNPPYSGISTNNGPWISDLIEHYKYIEGVHFGEKKHWLQDDYVKFIRMGEHVISEKNPSVMAFINNHAFIDNPTFRCMRWHLLNTFDSIYIFDLHGSTKKHETTPDGSKDENVFDIQQGVSINIFIRNNRSKNGLANVYHADLYGTREYKYDWLHNHSIFDVEWEQVTYSEPFYFFLNRNEENRGDWEKGTSIKDILLLNSTGILSARDGLVVDMDKQTLLHRIQFFADLTKDDLVVGETLFGKAKNGRTMPGDSSVWSMSNARREISHNNHEDLIKLETYRPFDQRFVYYSPDVVHRCREEVMLPMLCQENIALITTRQGITDDWANAFVSQYIVDDSMVSNRTKERGYVFPLLLDNGMPNISNEYAFRISQKLNLPYKSTREDYQAFTYRDIFYYVYAILYSKKYRRKFSDQLKSDFPHIPDPADASSFWKMVNCGKKLVDAHLMHFNDNMLCADYCGEIPCLVKDIRYEDNKVFLNKDNFFNNVRQELWDLYIGAYQPMQKWLKDRKGKLLSAEDIHHYAKIATAIDKTINTTHEIDSVIIL